MVKNYDYYFKIAQEINNKAGKYLLQQFGSIKAMRLKEEAHYTIPEDSVCNDLYEKFLRKKTPEVKLYTEEGERNLDKGLTWVIDPIEGTSNFRVRNPFFATQICLVEYFKPVISIVYAPKLDQLFHAIKGRGAFLNGKRLRVSEVNDLKLCLITLGKGGGKYNKWYAETLGKIMPHVRTIRSLGACGIEMAYTAAGITDFYVSNGNHLYDLLPGVLLIKEADGVVKNEKGKDWDLKDYYLIASNENLYSKVLNII